MRPEFPSVIDSSLIAAFRSCPRKAFLEYMYHWKPKDISVHLHAGGAYAKGLEVSRKAFYERTIIQPIRTAEGHLDWSEEHVDIPVSPETAVALGVGACLAQYGTFECPEDSAKSATRTAGALEYHFERYPLGVDQAIPLDLPGGKKAIEFGGVEPIDETHPVTGDPLQYSWRLDMAVKYNGLRLGSDDKTTSQLGASWPRQWNLRSQFTSYIWGAQRSAGLELDGFLIRGVSILKTKYDTMEAITYRPAWQIERWYEQMLRDVRRMKQCWEEGYFDYNLDHACTEYGGCMFQQVCLTRDAESILPQLYTRRRWDPIRRLEIPIKEVE